MRVLLYSIENDFLYYYCYYIFKFQEDDKWQ
jgi:hypothetical protein